MRIGLDLDNTLVEYDHIFHAVAQADGLVDGAVAIDKTAVRDHIRRHHRDGEHLWQVLQAKIYGPLLTRAPAFEGVRDFLVRARAQGCRFAVVSHKTRFAAADPDGCDLRAAATAWLAGQGFFRDGFVRESDVHYCDTRDEKVATIAQLGFDWFVDDLVEVLDHPGWPAATRRVLFHPAPPADLDLGILALAEWSAIADHLLGRP